MDKTGRWLKSSQRKKELKQILVNFIIKENETF